MGRGFVFLPWPAFLPFVIFLFLPKIRGVGPPAPPINPALA